MNLILQNIARKLDDLKYSSDSYKLVDNWIKDNIQFLVDSNIVVVYGLRGRVIFSGAINDELDYDFASDRYKVNAASKTVEYCKICPPCGNKNIVEVVQAGENSIIKIRTDMIHESFTATSKDMVKTIGVVIAL